MDFDILEARYVRDYVVWFRFRDGTTEYETIVWPNGADLAPDTLHMRVKADLRP